MAEPIISAVPDSLTLAPGESAPVNVAVDAASPYGVASVTVEVTVPAPYDGEIIGAFGGMVPVGEHWHITGDVDLTGDLVVEGLLTGIDAFTVDGHGLWRIVAQNGGRVQLAGVQKSAWVRWGEIPVGWQLGDRIVVAPTKDSIYGNTAATLPVEMTWPGWWDLMDRPVNSPAVEFLNGTEIEPEVLNLGQSIVFQNMRQGSHFHDGAGVQDLRYMRLLNCGEAGVLGSYSIHFHNNGEASRGSMIVGVVTEGSPNHSFVPHASHGITMFDCAAYKAKPGAFWWDAPPSDDKRSAINNSNDTTWDHNLTLLILGGTSITATGFSLGAGHGNKIRHSAAVCTVGGKNASGFEWPGHASQNDGGNVWESIENVSHNHRNQGVFIWQNGSSPFSGDDHLNTNWIIYNIGSNGWEHGAYSNNYEQRGFIIQNVGRSSNGGHAIGAHAIGAIKFVDLLSDDSVLIGSHSQETSTWVEYVGSVVTKFIYNSNEDDHYPSRYRIIDGWTPTGPIGPDDFVSWPNLTPIAVDAGGMNPGSEIEIVEAGVVVHRWLPGGPWS